MHDRYDTNLVQLKAYKSGHECGGGGNSGNDLARNMLRCVAIGIGDAVVGSTKIGASSNEVNVMVRVIILFKVDWVEAVASH